MSCDFCKQFAPSETKKIWLYYVCHTAMHLKQTTAAFCCRVYLRRHRKNALVSLNSQTGPVKFPCDQSGNRIFFSFQNHNTIMFTWGCFFTQWYPGEYFSPQFKPNCPLVTVTLKEIPRPHLYSSLTAFRFSKGEGLVSFTKQALLFT